MMLTLFAISSYLGYIWAEENPESSELFVKNVSENIIFIKDLPPFLILVIIILNNTVKSLVSMVLGVFFGIVPVIFITFNGFLLGVVFDVYSRLHGSWKVAMALIPHGVIEIPAVLIACSYGLKLGLKLIERIMGKDTDLRGEFYKALRVYVKYVFPMLIIAAFVETYLTPILSQV